MTILVIGHLEISAPEFCLDRRLGTSIVADQVLNCLVYGRVKELSKQNQI
jgi:hypothetical protein